MHPVPNELTHTSQTTQKSTIRAELSMGISTLFIGVLTLGKHFNRGAMNDCID